MFGDKESGTSEGSSEDEKGEKREEKRKNKRKSVNTCGVLQIEKRWKGYKWVLMG